MKGSHGIEIKADTFFDDVDFDQADLLVLPGGMPGTLHLGEHEGLTGLLQDFAAKGKRVAAICAAPSVLGGLGLLKGKTGSVLSGIRGQAYRGPGGDGRSGHRRLHYHQQRSGNGDSFCAGADLSSLWS